MGMKPRKRPDDARIREELMRQRVVENVLDHAVDVEEPEASFEKGYGYGVRAALEWAQHGPAHESPALRVYGKTFDKSMRILGLRKKDIGR